MTCQINTVQVGVIGFAFNMQVISNFAPMDIHTATTTKIYFLKPDGTKTNHDMSFLSDGKDGKLIYLTSAGDIDQPGTWKTQASIITPDSSWWTSIETFTVQNNIS